MPDRSKKSKSRRSATPASSFALPIAYWQDELAKGRERTASFRVFPGDAEESRNAATPIDELLRTYEELSVAEEELRSQNEELFRAHQLAEGDREHYRDLFERAPVPYIVTDSRGVILQANHSAATLLRYRAERLLGKPFAVFTQDACRRRFRSTLIELRSASENVTIGLNIQARGSRIIPVEVTGAAGRDSRGAVTEIRWLLIDRRRRLRAERARRRRTAELADLVEQRTAELRHAQEIKDQLLATVSHEFRTGLSAIGGYADLLAMGVRGHLTDQQLGDIRNIQQAYGHLAHLLNDLLDYSRLAAGAGIHLDLTDVAVGDAVRSIAGLVAPQARSKGVAVQVGPADGGANDVIVTADSERLAQVVLNLLGNAVKFTPSGGCVQVRWSTSATTADIEIIDSGPGIPAEKREAVFQPFVRLLRSPTPGTGLGLAISRDLARAMGGDISVSDGPQGGSSFVLRLRRSTRFASDSPAD
jgi:PAS domain S-box-containing protein